MKTSVKPNDRSPPTRSPTPSPSQSQSTNRACASSCTLLSIRCCHTSDARRNAPQGIRSNTPLILQRNLLDPGPLIVNRLAICLSAWARITGCQDREGAGTDASPLMPSARSASHFSPNFACWVHFGVE